MNRQTTHNQMQNASALALSSCVANLLVSFVAILVSLVIISGPMESAC